MALKGDRDVLQTDISFTLSDVAERGVVLCYSTAGSGQALGNKAGVATLASNPSGLKPLGMLLQDFVSVDQTKYHRNYHKVEQVLGDNAEIMRKGWVVTNKLSGTPGKGDTAYLTTSGQVTPTNGGAVATPKVGEFMGGKDEDGYVKVYIDLPIV